MKFTQIGVVVKPHGLKGHLVLKIEPAFAGAMQTFETLYLDRLGSKIPYRIEGLSVLSSGLFKVELAGITTADSVQALRGVPVCQEENRLPEITTTSLLGFTVEMEGKGSVGVVVEVIENKAQSILVIEGGQGEHLVPLADDYVVQMRAADKVLVLDLPEGLLDL